MFESSLVSTCPISWPTPDVSLGIPSSTAGASLPAATPSPPRAPAEPSQLASEENNADNVVRDPVDPLGLFDELEGPLDWPSEGLFDQETHSFLYLLFKYQTILIEVLAHASFMN